MESLAAAMPANLGLLAVGAQAVFATALGLRMSTLRVRQMKGKDAVPEKTFNLWHSVQLNAAEYHPLFMVLYASLHFAAKSEDRRLRPLSVVAILLGMFSSALFVGGATMITPRRGVLNPVRAAGGALRYISLLLLAFEVAH